MSVIKVGQGVFIRTVTMNHVGRITRVTKSWLFLEDASWVADSGRFGAALANGLLSEVERMPGTVAVSRAAVIDVAEWKHALPVDTK